MKREQVERGKIILDKLETLDRAMQNLTSTLNNNSGITLSASFTSKFKDELMIWMNAQKVELEKELESL